MASVPTVIPRHVSDPAANDPGAETWITAPRAVPLSACPGACLVQIYPTGPGMGVRVPIDAKGLLLGRDRDCDIFLSDPSVSRKHAAIQSGSDGHHVTDLASTNGTYVNDARAATARLRDGNYLRIGNYIFRYLAGGNVEAAYHEEIYRLAIVDGLTGVPNKRYLLEFLDRELARSARHARPLALILFDVDRFKAINDRFGHLGGDHALRDLAQAVRTAVRKEELFARYGGEEFAVVLPETAQAGAADVAERIRLLVELRGFAYEGEALRMTISLGVAATAGDASLTPNDLIRKADRNLYLAKSEGRNRVVG